MVLKKVYRCKVNYEADSSYANFACLGQNSIEIEILRKSLDFSALISMDFCVNHSLTDFMKHLLVYTNIKSNTIFNDNFSRQFLEIFK